MPGRPSEASNYAHDYGEILERGISNTKLPKTDPLVQQQQAQQTHNDWQQILSERTSQSNAPVSQTQTNTSNPKMELASVSPPSATPQLIKKDIFVEAFGSGQRSVTFTPTEKGDTLKTQESSPRIEIQTKDTHMEKSLGGLINFAESKEITETVSSSNSDSSISSPNLIDFSYFFSVVADAGAGAFNAFRESTLNSKNAKFQAKDVKSAVMDDLVVKQLFNRVPKEPSKEEKEKTKKRARNKRSFFQQLTILVKATISLDRKRSLRERIAYYNNIIGMSNPNYEGIVDPRTGDIKPEIIEEAEKINSQKSKEQMQKKKKQQMLASTGSVKRKPGITLTADKSHNFNNAAKLAG